MRPAVFSPRAIFLLLTLALLSATLTARAMLLDHTKLDEAAAKVLLAKSRDLSNLELAGSPAFVLSANIHFQEHGHSADGDLRILWTAPDHYRQTYSVLNYAYTAIAKDGKLYLARTNEDVPLLIYEAQKTVRIAMRSDFDSKQKLTNVRTAQFSGQTLTCVSARLSSISHTDCFDADNDVVTAERDWPAAASALDQRYEFSDFVAFGVRRFPQKLTFRGGDGHIIEIEIQKLALAKDISASEFTIPIPSAVETWCAQPQFDAPRVSRPETTLDLRMALAQGPATPLIVTGASVYCVVERGGRIRFVTLVHSLKPIKDEFVRNWARGTRFPLLRCGDDSVEYQTEITFAH